MKHVFQGIGILVFLLVTTGIILPWVISNFILPLWMILVTLGVMIAIWFMVLEIPVRKLFILLKSQVKEAQND
jgi:uncharacterized membrane protein YgaE (UPF0421/DUF939 family)